MKKFFFLTVVVFIATMFAGCTSTPQTPVEKPEEKPVNIQKFFLNRAIVYSVDADAAPILRKTIILLNRKLNPTEKDAKEIASLLAYRNSDENRDHNITATEAERYYQSTVLDIEDELDD